MLVDCLCWAGYTWRGQPVLRLVSTSTESEAALQPLPANYLLGSATERASHRREIALSHHPSARTQGECLQMRFCSLAL